MVEKSVIAYGGVQMGLLERGPFMDWIIYSPSSNAWISWGQ